MDWEKCVLCQEDSEELVDPLQNKNFAVDGYSKLASNIELFVNHDVSFPYNVSVSHLRVESDIAANLHSNRAKWHKQCALEISSSKLQRAMKRKAKCDTSNTETPLKRCRTSFSPESPSESAVCYFCDENGLFVDDIERLAHLRKDEKDKRLHRATSLALSANIKKAATEMSDVKILAKLSAGDMIAREACYHKDCMSQFSNKYRNHINKASKTKKDHQQNLESIAQTMLFIEESLHNITQRKLLLLSSFLMFENFTKHVSKTLMLSLLVNATRLKTSILELNENLEATPGKKEVLVSFMDDLAEALRYTREHSAYQNAAHLIKAASIIKKTCWICFKISLVASLSRSLFFRCYLS